MTDRPIISPSRVGANNPNWRGGTSFTRPNKRHTDQAYRTRNRDKINARKRAAYAADAPAQRAQQAEYRQKNYQAVLNYNRRWSMSYRARIRAEMIAAYGGQCKCCGEKEPSFLQLDHVENDGYLERKIHKTSTKICAALKRRGWPKGRYQLLCANCNFSKQMNGGVCPHVR